MIAFAEIRLRVDGIYAHVPHHPAYFLMIDTEFVIVPNNLCDHWISPCWMGRVISSILCMMNKSSSEWFSLWEDRGIVPYSFLLFVRVSFEHPE